MFSNQYLGTRMASRSLPRPNMTANAYSPTGPYTRMNLNTMNERPINARADDVEGDDDVDYTFMNLPVRERRKLFLGGGQAPKMQPAMAQSFTMPRRRPGVPHRPQRYETQSEFGGEETFPWEPAVTPGFNRGQYSAPPMRGGSVPRATTTRTLNLSTSRPTRLETRPVQETMYRDYIDRVAVSVPPTSPPTEPHHSPVIIPAHQSRQAYRPQFSTTVRVNDHTKMAPSPRLITSSGTRIYPVRRYSSNLPRQMDTMSAYGTEEYYQPMTAPVVHSSVGRTSQPLRVNVYNSDGYVTERRIQRREPYQQSALNSSWLPSSPVYPAYPAYMDYPLDGGAQVYRMLVQSSQSPQSTAYYQPDRDSTHTTYIPLRTASPRQTQSHNAEFQSQRPIRQQSVQPVTIYPSSTAPIRRKVETQQTWQPMMAPVSHTSLQPVGAERRYRRPVPPRRDQPQTIRKDLDEQIGVSDF